MPFARRHRRIKSASITHVSLCRRGKNQCRLIAKADGLDDAEVEVLSKISDEFDANGEIYAVVWPANRPDSDGDWADQDTVRDMAHKAMRNGVVLDMEHDGVEIDRDRAYIAESFIIQEGDPRFDGIDDYSGEEIDPTGSWGQVIKVLDKKLKADVKSGRIGGVSMFGPALLTHEAPPAPPAALAKSDETVLERILKRLGIGQEDDEMKPEDVKKMVAETVAETLEKAGVVKKAESGDTGKLKAPDIDFTDPEALEKHAKALRKAQAAKDLDVDWTDPVAVEKHARGLRAKQLLAKHDVTTTDGAKAYAEALAKLQEGGDAAAAGDSSQAGDESSTESDEVKKARAELAASQRKLDELRKASRQPGAAGSEKDVIPAGLSKAEAESLKLGDEMAATINSMAGFGSRKEK